FDVHDPSKDRKLRKSALPEGEAAVETIEEAPAAACELQNAPAGECGIDMSDKALKGENENMNETTLLVKGMTCANCERHVKNALPWVALNEEGRRVVSVPATASDCFWQTMDTTEASPEYISRIADNLITADGTAGEIIDVMDGGGWPILIAHWQSLFSNGLGTGLKALAEVARRIEANLSDRVEWMSSEEIMRLVLEHPERYPAPAF
ncbi:MAG: heavy-metal-associated domain-containing protein, partial [Clostridia bacterium]|nr:heavy-metal-associated domain-containing protein [Clostridia bacterium]